jgi:hypothetical protein
LPLSVLAHTVIPGEFFSFSPWDLAIIDPNSLFHGSFIQWHPPDRDSHCHFSHMLRIPGKISLSIPGILQSSPPILYSMACSRMLFADIQQLTCTALSFANLWCRSATVCCLDLRSRAGRIYQRSVQRRPPDHNCHFQFSPYDYCDSRQFIETSDSRNDAGGEPSQLQASARATGRRAWP